MTIQSDESMRCRKKHDIERKRIGPFGADPFLKSCFHFCLSEDTLLCVLQNRDLCVIFVIDMLSVVFLRLCNDDAGKQKDRDNIRDRHQSVQKIGKIPYEVQFLQRSDEDRCDPEDLIDTR